MPNVSSFGAQTDNAVVSGTVTDRQMIIPEVPPQGLMSVGPRVTPNFVQEPWSKANSYNFFDVVKDAAGSSYIAIKPVVPTNTELADEEFWFKWSDPDAQLTELQEIVKTYNERILQNASAITAEVARATTAEATKAPTNHASEETIYGVGNAANYGHLKLADDGTPMTSGANDGIAATPYMVLAQNKQQINLGSYNLSNEADNSEIINNAISENTGKVFILPDGVYPIANTINVINDNELICVGTLKAISNTMKYMVTVNNNVASSGDVFDLTTKKNYMFKCDCNNQSGVSGIGTRMLYKCSIDAFIKNCTATGYTSDFDSTNKAGMAENEINLTFINKNAHPGSTGALQQNGDDRYTSVNCVNANTAIKVMSNNITIDFIHAWLTSDALQTLWNTSCCIYNGGDTTNIGTLICDTMRNGVNVVSGIAQIQYYKFIHIEDEIITQNKPIPFTGGDYEWFIFVNYYQNQDKNIDMKDFNNYNFSMKINQTNGLYNIKGDLKKCPAGTYRVNSNDVTDKPTEFTNANAILKVTSDYQHSNKMYQLMGFDDSTSASIYFVGSNRGTTAITWHKVY